MGVVYNCKYCGKESQEEPLQYEGKAVNFQDFIDKKIDEVSAQCECQKNKSFSVKCNKCGEEIILTNSTKMWRDEQIINIGFDNIYENINFSCNCGNEISF